MGVVAHRRGRTRNPPRGDGDAGVRHARGGRRRGAILAGLGFGVVVQVLAFVIVSVALIGVVRPIAARHSAQRPQLVSGVEALKGKQAVVLERVDGSGGRIKLAGEVWSARALDAGSAYEVGQEVDVVEIEGATAIVI